MRSCLKQGLKTYHEQQFHCRLITVSVWVCMLLLLLLLADGRSKMNDEVKKLLE